MTPERFHAAAPLVPILCVGFLAQTLYTLLGPEIFYAKRTWLVPVVSAAGLITTLGAAALLAPAYGAAGIAWATSFGSIAATIAAVYFSLQTVRVPHDWLGLARAGSVCAVVFFGGYWFHDETPWRQALAGAAALALFPALLWASGDPGIREVASHARGLTQRA
jgi:O-antigen/teichoic acid export membrane protein